MNIIFYQPPEHLSRYIRYFWSCDMLDFQSERIIYFDNYADRFPRFVFQFDDGYALKSKEDKHIPKAYICGIDTYASSMTVQANFSHFGVSFNSFAPTAIFKTNESLVNEIIDLHDLGYTDLIQKLTDAKSHEERVQIMGRFIDDQLSHKVFVNDNIMQIVLENELTEQTDLFKLQKKYKTTERTMERLFKNAMGISPKTFQRLVRFEKTLALLKDPAYGNSAMVGHMLNYTDQSHFIKDFKAFTNITPFQFQKNNFLLSESSAFIKKI